MGCPSLLPQKHRPRDGAHISSLKAFNGIYRYLPRASTRGRSPLAEALGNGVEEGVVTMMEIY